jgi:CubicO group peptidase (beta-lactamase class C family)
MQGFPPPATQTIRFEDLPTLEYPAHRWVYSHWRELVPTARVWRGTRPAQPLRQSAKPLADFAFEDPDGGRLRLEDALLRTDTDGLLVLHDGQVVFERYLGELGPHVAHRCWSVTKSFVGLLAAMLENDGTLDPDSAVVAHLPELAASGWAGATVRQLMDMTLNLDFDEDYDSPRSDVVPSRTAKGGLPRPPGYAGPRSIYEYLPTVRAGGEHGRAFQYSTPNSDVLAWILQRLTGKSLAVLLSERLWQRLGAEEDGYISVDPVGIADAGGGLCVTLRDLARLGEAIRNRGRVGGEQVIAQAVIEDIARGGDREKFARAGWALFDGWSYRSQWWVSHDEFASVRALGVHGQQLYVAPRAGLVVARFGSQRIAVDEKVELLLMAAFRALAKMLAG